MHLLGLVIVPQASREDVERAMARFQDAQWDWYRIGGRWDGWLQGPDEMQARRTHNGFNFDAKNEEIVSNSMSVREYARSLRKDDLPAFYVCEGKWQTASASEHPLFAASLADALDGHADFHVVIVDAHA